MSQLDRFLHAYAMRQDAARNKDQERGREYAERMQPHRERILRALLSALELEEALLDEGKTTFTVEGVTVSVLLGGEDFGETRLSRHEIVLKKGSKRASMEFDDSPRYLREAKASFGEALSNLRYC